MNEVNKMFLEGIIKEKEWNDFFIEIVKKYGSELMLIQIKIHQNTINSLKIALSLNRENI